MKSIWGKHVRTHPRSVACALSIMGGSQDVPSMAVEGGKAQIYLTTTLRDRASVGIDFEEDKRTLYLILMSKSEAATAL